MRAIILFLLLFLAFVFINCSKKETTEPAEFGSIKGKVYEASTGAFIKNVGVETDPPTGAVTTDSTGAYIITNVEPSQYTIYAEKLGYISNSVKIQVIAGNSTIGDIALEIDSTFTSGFQ